MAPAQHLTDDIHGTPRMNTFTKLIDLVLVGALGALLTGCPGDKDGSDSDPGPASGIGETGGTPAAPAAGGETGAEAAPSPEGPQAIPLLCSVDGGKWCKGCPQGSAGALCCAGETCLPWDAASGVACEGSLGWCSNYSVAEKLVTCHDVK